MADTVLIQKATLQEHQRALHIILEEFDRVCKALDIPYVLFAGTMLGAVRHQGFIPWDDDLDVLILREDYERFLANAETVLDKQRFCLQKEYTEHWPMFFSKLRLNGTTCLEKYHPKDPQTHQGIYIDIFPCDNAAKSAFGRKVQFLASKIVISKSLYIRGYDTNSKLKKLAMAICGVLPWRPFLDIVKGSQRKMDMVHVFLGGGANIKKSVFPKEYLQGSVKMDFEGGQYPVPNGYDPLLKILYGDYMTLPPEKERATKEHAILVDIHNSYENYANYRDGMEFEVLTKSIR